MFAFLGLGLIASLFLGGGALFFAPHFKSWGFVSSLVFLIGVTIALPANLCLIKGLLNRMASLSLSLADFPLIPALADIAGIAIIILSIFLRKKVDD